MQTIDFDEGVEQIIAQDSRYAREAYRFVREVLTHIQKKLAPNKKIQVQERQPRHISVQELLEGVRQYTLEEFGPMGLYVLAEWGIHRCEDVGEIVFNLVEAHLLSKEDRDVREDFADGFDFEETLAWPFLPPSELLRRKAQSQTKADKRTRP